MWSFMIKSGISNLQSRVFGRGYISRFDGKYDGIHEILRSLNAKREYLSTAWLFKSWIIDDLTTVGRRTWINDVAESNPETISSPEMFWTSALTFDVIFNWNRLKERNDIDNLTSKGHLGALPEIAPETDLMCVEGDSLQICDQISFRSWIWTLIRDIASDFVQLITAVTDSFRRVDNIHSSF